MKHIFLFVGVFAGLALRAIFLGDLESVKAGLTNRGVSLGVLNTYLSIQPGTGKQTLSPDSAPWAGFYNPYTKGGIASRWQSTNPA